jgi:hypothetical protein
MNHASVRKEECRKLSAGGEKLSIDNGLRALRAVVFLPLTLLLVACDDLSCDSVDVLQTTKELVIQRIRNSGFYESFDIAISDIRVQDGSSEQQLLCKANAAVTNSKTLTAMGAPAFTYDVDYRVERTTDGSLYITVYPLHMLQK